MTVAEEMALHDAVLDGLTAADEYLVERQMTSALLALCHAQQIELAVLRRNYELAKGDLARLTRLAVQA